MINGLDGLVPSVGARRDFWGLELEGNDRARQREAPGCRRPRISKRRHAMRRPVDAAAQAVGRDAREGFQHEDEDEQHREANYRAQNSCDDDEAQRDVVSER